MAGNSFTSGALSSWLHRLARSLEASASRNHYQYRCARRSVRAATFLVPSATTYHWMVSVRSSVQEAEEESAPRQIHVGLNWFEELKRRVPTR